MAVKIRLQRKGRKKAPFYYIVVADSRSPRDGRFVERIGSYNPLLKPAEIEIDSDRAIYWLNEGAGATKTVRDLLSRHGVLYRKHLLRGVKMGVLTAEEADAKYNEFLKQKAEKLEKEIQKISEERIKAKQKRFDAEAKVNEQRISKIQEKHKKEIQAKHAESAEEETAPED